VSPLWHHDGGFTGAAGEGEDEEDDAPLDDDNDAAADAAVLGGTFTTGPGWKCDPPFLGAPLRSIVAGIGCALRFLRCHARGLSKLPIFADSC